MFSNENTLWIEIIVIVLVILFLISLLSIYLYKKIHHLPMGECAMCQSKKNNLLKQYHKKYSTNKK